MPRVQSRGFRRALAVLAVLLAVWGGFAVPQSFADQCKYCSQELEEGVNPLKCPSCTELATRIARNDDRVWVLDFQQGDLGRLQIKDDTGDTETYWYLPYTLTNRDEKPRNFFIEITAGSDRGKHTFAYHDMFIPDVYAAIRRALGKRQNDQLLTKRELAMPPTGERNVLPQISDNRTKETARIALPTIQPGETLRCVAIMGPFHPEMDRLVISVRGLTNSSILAHDDYVAPEGEPHRRVIKEAVLQLHYSRPGDEFAHGQDVITFEGRRWTDATRVVKSDLR